MQFKHPEILYFLFLLAIPILVHLFQLRRFKKEYFTNVRFLKALSIQTRKSSKLKKYLLLAVRLLLLACVVLAFAQPFFKAKDHNDASNEMYIVLDNSFSMQAKGQKGPLLKRAVEDLLENIPENVQFSLLTNTENFYNTDIKSIRRDVQNLDYSAAPFAPDQQLARIRARQSALGKDIIVITDAVGLKPSQLKGFPENNTHFIIPKAQQKSNVSVDSVYIRQTLDNFYDIGITLKAYGGDFKALPVALYNQGKLVAKTLVSLEGKQKDISFTIPKSDFNGYVSISDNALEYDNKRYFSIAKPEKTNVIAVGEPDKNAFLSRIYTGDEFNFGNFSLQSLDYNLLEKQDAIILNQLKEIPQALQTTLKSFVEKGGNVVVVPDAQSQAANLTAFLSQFGAVRISGLQQGEKLVNKINFSHPLFSGVFEKKIDNFQYPQTKSNFAVSGNAAAALTYDDQSNFLTALRGAISSVYFFSAPIDKANSNFQNSPLIVPVFYNMAQSSVKTGIVAATIGESQPFMVDALLSKDEIVSVKDAADASGERFIPVQQILNNKVRLTFNDYPRKAGNFGVYKQDEWLRNISFNYAHTESDLTQDNTAAVADFKTADTISLVFDELQTGRTDSQIWKWFAIFALLLLITEILIQKLVK